MNKQSLSVIKQQCKEVLAGVKHSIMYGSMSNLNLWKVVFIILLTLVVAGAVAFFLGAQWQDEQYVNNLVELGWGADLSEQLLHSQGAQIDNFIESMNSNIEITGLTVNGHSSTSIEWNTESWSAWFTSCEATLTTDYNALLGIDAGDIVYQDTGKGFVNVIINQRDVEILALEQMNETTEYSKQLLSKGFDQAELQGARDFLSTEIREEVLTPENIEQALKNLKGHIREQAEAFGIKIRIVTMK